MKAMRKIGRTVHALIGMLLVIIIGVSFAFAMETAPSLPSQVVEVLSRQGLVSGVPSSPHDGAIETTTDVKADSESEQSVVNKLEIPVADAASASEVESRYRNSYSSFLAAKLKQFGYEIFATAHSKQTRLAVPSDTYRIGPGDKLRVRVWGSGVDSEYVGVVEKNGTINIPQIGIVDISDVSYGQVEQVIRKESEKYIQGANINVTLVDLRSVEVYVVGSVLSPSLHVVPAFSTVFDSLLAAGGVNRSGSLRRIELYRDGQLYKRFDLYDLLLRGKRDADLVLQNRDVIFVPRLGATVAVAGAVKEPAIFELNGEKTVSDCLAMAGGILPQGYASRLHLRRYQNNNEFIVSDIDTQANPNALSTKVIQDGDLIEWVFLSERMPQVVSLVGHVWNPDTYEYKPGMTIRDVLTSVKILKPDAVTDFALLHRYDSNTTRFTIQRIPLKELFLGEFSMPLQVHDKIEILSREQLGIKENIAISGAVWQPGIKPYSQGMTLGGALALAGGSRFGALLSGIEVSRQEIVNGEALTTIYTLDTAKDSAFVLMPSDYILVKEVKEANTTQTVHISGEVRFPGDYKLADGERLSSLIKRAGGFLPSAYYYGAKFTSVRAMTIQQKSLDDMIARLEMQAKQTLAVDVQRNAGSSLVSAETLAQEAVQKALGTLKSLKVEGRVAIQLADEGTFAGSAYDFVLEDGDALIVPKQHNFVSVVGSVYSPNSFHYEPNRTVEYYMKKSGGGTKDADTKSVYVLKANGEVLSKAQQGGMLSWSSFESQIMMPGDTIVVPVNFERVPYLGLIKDIADIVFKIATTTGIAIATF